MNGQGKEMRKEKKINEKKEDKAREKNEWTGKENEEGEKEIKEK